MGVGLGVWRDVVEWGVVELGVWRSVGVMRFGGRVVVKLGSGEECVEGCGGV